MIGMNHKIHANTDEKLFIDAMDKLDEAYNNISDSSCFIHKFKGNKELINRLELIQNKTNEVLSKMIKIKGVI